jgi:hypothetical protein
MAAAPQRSVPDDCALRLGSQKSFSLESQRGVAAMLLDILRLALAFGVVVLVIGFWYWVMDTLGTF